MKTKHLLPSLREKKRYIAFDVLSQHAVSFRQAADAITDSALTFLGVKGVADAGINAVTERWDAKGPAGVVRVSHKHVDNVKASFLFITDIEGHHATVRSTCVSGSLANTGISKEVQ